MNIKLTTIVKCPFELVKANFDKDLFHYLAPPPFIAKVEKYEGNKAGDLVVVNFRFPVKGKWISEIVSHEENDDKLRFEDKGIQLPLGLSGWYHTHLVEKLDQEHTKITDELHFTASNALLKIPLYFGLYSGFAPRKVKYRKYFQKIKNE